MSVVLRRGGIIAAGDGTRLRAGGYTMPKALVPVGGVPLIEAAIRNFQASNFSPESNASLRGRLRTAELAFTVCLGLALQ